MKSKDRKISIKWKIFTLVSICFVFLLGFLWLFQIEFLDIFYKNEKVSNIKETAHDIVNNIEDENIESYIDSKVENSDYCVRIINMSTGGTYVNERNRGVCGAIISNPKEIDSLYTEAVSNEGEVIRTNKVEMYQNFNEYTRNGKLDTDSQPARKLEDSESMTYGEITSKPSGLYFVMVNSRITMINEISSTLKSQLVIITGCLLLIAVVFALIMSNWISKPIININNSAKKLAKKDFSVEFTGKGYLEIEELNETLNAAREELKKTEDLRKELIANLSHDLRTPLTMIAGYGEVMRDLPGENTPENVQIIIDESHRLTSLVNDIMDLSKLDSGIQSLNLDVCNLTIQTKEVVNRFNKMLEKEGYTIVFEYDKEVNVNCDTIKMNQVLYNLLVNATHYTGKDKLVVVKQTVSDGKVTIQVIDTGEGIPQDQLPYVWERYYKLDKVHKRNTVGSGLGLSIVRGILELHKAVYGVTSSSSGTTFYFTLDIIQEA